VANDDRFVTAGEYQPDDFDFDEYQADEY